MDTSRLAEAGLGPLAVFDLATLPATVRQGLDAGIPDDARHDPGDACGHDFPRDRRLVLIAHHGPRFWTALSAARSAAGSGAGISCGDDPIDRYSERVVAAWAAACFAGRRWRLLYPAADGTSPPIDLMALGELAGWHHPAPFRLGVNDRWGSWFAYRALLRVDAALPPTPPLITASPCRRCARPCVDACPAHAMDGGGFSLERCLAWRRRPGSSCALTCLARLACPVAPDERYPPEQIAHAYGASLRLIRRTDQEPNAAFAKSATEGSRPNQ